MKKILNLVSVLFAVLVLFGSAKADTIELTATLTGSQEVPPTGSPGIGSALVRRTVYHCMNRSVICLGTVVQAYLPMFRALQECLSFGIQH